MYSKYEMKEIRNTKLINDIGVENLYYTGMNNHLFGQFLNMSIYITNKTYILPI